MKRCLSTGGTLLLTKPISEAVAEATYQKVIDAFGLKEKSPEDRINALIAIPVNDLWQKVPQGTPLLPLVDGETVPGDPNFFNITSQDDDPRFLIPGRKWCSALMIGDSKLDVSLTVRAASNHTGFNFTLLMATGKHLRVYGT
jgi:hypothetical protein